MDARYRKSSGCAFNIKYHFVWCPKYRRPVLTDRIAKRLKILLFDKSKEQNWVIEALEIMPDHVHIFVSTDTTDAPQRIANQLKGYTSNMLRNEFSELKSRLPTLWSRSYYVGTVGHVSENTVRQYIENQKGK